MAAKTKIISLMVITVIVILLLPLAYPTASAQAPTLFQAGDPFTIPDSNATIKFARNGNYTSAVLENGAWHFTHIKMNRGTLENLTISAQNTNVTVSSFSGGLAFNGTVPSYRFSCNVTGAGTFNVKFLTNITVTETTRTDWYVTTGTGTDINFYSAGKNWNFAPDDSVAINGLTGVVGITYYATSEYGRNLTRSQSFFDQHSVVIVTAIILGLTVAAVAVVKVRQNKKQPEELR
jgi:hypothetical protein